MPVYKLLGGAHREYVTPYATGLYFTKESDDYEEFIKPAVEEAEKYKELGFKGIKMKIALPRIAELKRVQAVREAIGDNVELMVDANHGYNLYDAQWLAHEFEKLKISWFGKYCNAINDNGGIFYTNGRSVTYEGELGVIIGKTGKNISAAKADEYIAGFTVVNDISANDRIREDIQLFRGKNMDGALPMGPVLVSKDEIDNPMKLHIRTMVDGDIVQDSCTDQMIFDIYQQIEYFSEFMTLTPGDIIATGTPAGTALQYNPPRFLKPGQRVVIEIEKIGRLETIIA